MLAAEFATKRPKGLRRLIIADSPADMTLWQKVQNDLRRTLPQEVQNTMTKCETEGRTSSEEYKDAAMNFYKRYVIRNEFPPELLDGFKWVLEVDPTVYSTM